MRSTLVCLLAIVAPLWADITIAREDQVPNRKPGWCVWTSLETLGRHHKITALEGVAAHYMKHVPEGGATLADAIGALRHLGVAHRYCERPDAAFLGDACRRNRGAVVVLDNWPKPGAIHAVVLIAFDDKHADWIDSNYPGWRYTAGRTWFDRAWTSWAIVLEAE